MDTPSESLEVLYESESVIAINKPHGLLVHRSNIAKDAHEFALQKVRKYCGQRIYLCHRLDRKTSGVLIFAKDQHTNQVIQSQFRSQLVIKKYKAIVRGYVNESGMIDYALKNNDKIQEAQTAYTCLRQFEIKFPSNGFPTSRYSLVECQPKTGRFHQIRKHFAHIRHPIIGDRPHGCNKQNKIWKYEFGIDTMLLHAEQIQFNLEDLDIQIIAPLSSEFKKAINFLESPME